MNIAGAMFTFARPDYLERVLESLEDCRGVNEIDWFFYQDGLKNSPNRSSYESIKGEDIELVETLLRESKIPHEYIGNETNKGINYQFNQALSLFQEGYDTIIVLEDDLVLSPYYLELLKQCSLEFPNMINTFYSTNPNRATSRRQLRELMPSPGYRYWGFYMTREAYDNIRPAWESEYSPESRSPFYDGILSRAARTLTNGKFCSRYTRAYNIGEEGVLSYNKENFVSRGISRQNKDIYYEEDENLHGFLIRP